MHKRNVMMLHQLTRDQILHLVTPSLNDQSATVTVHAVLTHLTDPEPTIMHDGPVTLRLQFSRHDGRRKLRAHEPSRLVLLSVQGMNWAEYHVDHGIDTDGTCVTEDYQMRLFREDGQGPEQGFHEARAAAEAQSILLAVGTFCRDLGADTVVIGDPVIALHAVAPDGSRCQHPPLCPYGACGTMLCTTCGTFYATCHHAVFGAEEDVLVPCRFCDTLVWVPVSLVDEPAVCPDHTDDDPSEPGHPDNPRSA